MMYSLLKSYSEEIAQTWANKVEPAVTDIADWLKALQQKHGDKVSYVE